MKNFLFLLLLAPACILGQTCKPVAEVGGHTGTSDITKKEIASLSKIEVSGCAGEWKIISYEFTMKIKGQPVSYNATGADLSIEERASMSKASKIFFDNVKAKGPDGKVISIPGLTLKVKD